MILTNSRVPQERVGDFKAQMARSTSASGGSTILLDRYGAETVEAVIREVRSRAEKQMRAHIAACRTAATASKRHGQRRHP